jgi:hypothetical protein
MKSEPAHDHTTAPPYGVDECEQQLQFPSVQWDLKMEVVMGNIH